MFFSILRGKTKESERNERLNVALFFTLFLSLSSFVSPLLTVRALFSAFINETRRKEGSERQIETTVPVPQWREQEENKRNGNLHRRLALLSGPISLATRTGPPLLHSLRQPNRCA